VYVVWFRRLFYIITLQIYVVDGMACEQYYRTTWILIRVCYYPWLKQLTVMFCKWIIQVMCTWERFPLKLNLNTNSISRDTIITRENKYTVLIQSLYYHTVQSVVGYVNITRIQIENPYSLTKYVSPVKYSMQYLMCNYW